MQLKYLRVGFLVPALAVFSLFARDAAAQCPESEPPRRATSGPYHYLRDRLVTDSLTPSDTQNKARESSISGDTSLSIGYETIHATANAVYLQRFNTNGTRRCLFQFGNWDEPYIRLDDPSTPGQHRHVSVAQRHLTSFSSSHHCSRNPVVFACWQATATQGTLPDLMQFAQPFPIQIAGDFRQTIFDSNPGRVAIPNLNRNDVAPSGELSHD